MSGNKVAFAVLISLQALTFGLLCYVTFEQKKGNVYVVTTRRVAEPEVGVSGEEDNYGLRREIAEQIEKVLAGRRFETETTIGRFDVTVASEEPIIMSESVDLPEQVQSELLRYPVMSAEEKRKFAKELSDLIMERVEPQVEELLRKIRQAVRDVEKDSGS